MSDTPQERGYQFEKDFASSLGVEPQKGSGSQWTAKLDVADGTILWSLKHTDKKSFRLSKDLMREAQEAITGQGGVGGSTIPGVATSVGGEIYVTLLADDFMRLLSSGEFYIPATKSDQKRKRASVPGILREE